MGSLKRAARIVGVNLALLLGLAVLIDLVLGDWLAADNLGPLRIPRDLEARFDASALYGRAEPIVYRRDRFGLRGDYPDAARIDVLTIGGSTTDQRYLSDEDTWQAVLARAFADAGRPQAVVNAGVDGHSTIGHLKSFEHWFPRIPNLKARFMLFYVGINDVFTEFHYWSDRVLEPSLKRQLVQLYRNNSIYYRAYRDLKGWWLAREAKLAHGLYDFARMPWTDQPRNVDHLARYADRLVAYEGRLRRLMDATRALGARPILVTQPRGDARFVDGRWLGAVDGFSSDWRFWPEDNGLDRRIILDLFNQVALRVCRETPEAICVPLAEELRFTLGDFYDHVHVTPAGARRIGRYLFERIGAEVAPPPSGV